MKWLLIILVLAFSLPDARAEDSVPVPVEKPFLLYVLQDPLVRVILHEAEDEPYMGMVAVGGVDLDRVTDGRWPDTLWGVVLQRAQFSYIHRALRPYTHAQAVKAYEAAQEARRGSRPCGDGVYWYHATYIDPPVWTETMTVACTVGLHIFYRKLNS